MSVGAVNKSTGDRIPTAGNPLDKVGDLSLLHTSAKSNAVAAINEVADKVATKQDALTFDSVPTDGSNNPVKSNGVYDALALKQNATDNSLDTDAKTIVGAINEHEGDISALKSGFTNLDNEVNGDATVYPYADVITIEDAVPTNVAGCTVKIEPVQSGSGDPSPTNVRPITGHTETSVEVTDGDEITNTYTIALGDTIYGGTVDFNSGVMTVDRACFIGDGSSDEDWNITGTGRLQIRNVPNVKQYADITKEFLICSVAIKSDSSASTGTITYSSGVFVLYLDGFKDKTLNEWKTYIASNPVYICYELATPTTIQLTPQQIQLLKGQNTLTASTGDISVTANGVSGAIGSVQEQVNDTDEALAELSDKLPTAPTTDGAYVLTVTVASGTPSYSWESAT